ncbi:hypothetical protein ABIB39_002693 [Mucilaginibacter sp. UYP27]
MVIAKPNTFYLFNFAQQIPNPIYSKCKATKEK